MTGAIVARSRTGDQPRRSVARRSASHAAAGPAPCSGVGPRAEASSTVLKKQRAAAASDPSKISASERPSDRSRRVGLGDRGGVGATCRRGPSRRRRRGRARRRGGRRPWPPSSASRNWSSEHRPVGERAVARAQPARRGDRGELVTAQVHVGLDRAVELAPGGVHVRAVGEGPGEIRQVAEDLAVGLVHRVSSPEASPSGTVSMNVMAAVSPACFAARSMIDKRLRSVALLVAGCFFMEILDGTIVVTAVPQMSASLGVAGSSTALVITAYLLTLAVLIPLSGWMTVRFGPRRVFLSAIAIFTLASLGCALSTTLAELVALRIVQGAGGAMMVPVGRLVVLGRAAKSRDPADHVVHRVARAVAPVIAPWPAASSRPTRAGAGCSHQHPARGSPRLRLAADPDAATGTPPPLDGRRRPDRAGPRRPHLRGPGRGGRAAALDLAIGFGRRFPRAVRRGRAASCCARPAPLIDLRTLRVPCFGGGLAAARRSGAG